MSSRAQAFRESTQARRQAAAVELTLPQSGLKVLALRPSLEVWMMSGRIPQAFTQKILELFGSGEKPSAQKVLDAMRGPALMDSLIFVREFVKETLVSPRIVVGRPADPGQDEIEPTDIDEKDFAFIFQWAISGSPGVPVETAGGEVSVEALDRFPRQRSRRGARAGQQKVRSTAE